jgi:FkbM family methyltransferase
MVPGPLDEPRRPTYGFDGEDQVLWDLVGDQPTGFFVDVGCNDPVSGCVSKSFYDVGWVGINVDPLRYCIDKFDLVQPRSQNICAALGEIEQDEVPVYSSSECDHWATVRPEIAGRKAMAEVDRVPMTTLAAVFTRLEAVPELDWLKVDVEGHEAEVLRGNDWDRFRPRFCCIEAREPHRYPVPSYGRWEPQLLAQGYRFVAERLLNRFYERLVPSWLSTPTS